MRLNTNNYIICASILILSILIVHASNARPMSRSEVKRMVIEEASNSIVPTALALAVAKVESNFNPKALSSAGARGVMQIMPSTGRGEFGVHPDELWDARLNIELGVNYLAQLYRRYGYRWDLALSHYNGGTLRGSGKLARPHVYTRKYVRSVKKWEKRYQRQAVFRGPVENVFGLNPEKALVSPRETFEADREEIKTALLDSLKIFRKLKNENPTSKRLKKYGQSTQTSLGRPVNRAFWYNEARQDDAFSTEFFKRLRRNREWLDDFSLVIRVKKG